MAEQARFVLPPKSDSCRDNLKISDAITIFQV